MPADTSICPSIHLLCSGSAGADLHFQFVVKGAIRAPAAACPLAVRSAQLLPQCQHSQCFDEHVQRAAPAAIEPRGQGTRPRAPRLQQPRCRCLCLKGLPYAVQPLWHRLAGGDGAGQPGKSVRTSAACAGHDVHRWPQHGDAAKATAVATHGLSAESTRLATAGLCWTTQCISSVPKQCACC